MIMSKINPVSFINQVKLKIARKHENYKTLTSNYPGELTLALSGGAGHPVEISNCCQGLVPALQSSSLSAWRLEAILRDVC